MNYFRVESVDPIRALVFMSYYSDASLGPDGKPQWQIGPLPLSIPLLADGTLIKGVALQNWLTASIPHQQLQIMDKGRMGQMYDMTELLPMVGKAVGAEVPPDPVLPVRVLV